MQIVALVLCLAAVILANGDNPHQNPHFARGHVGIVHLFEWKWKDIALECERFLGPKGFGGVQVRAPSLAWHGSRQQHVTFFRIFLVARYHRFRKI